MYKRRKTIVCGRYDMRELEVVEIDRYWYKWESIGRKVGR